MKIKNSKIITGIMMVFILAIGNVQGQDTTTQPADSVKERPMQVSFVPFFGTSNGPDDGYTNNFSLNIIGGYEHSLNGAEFGSLFNIDKRDIKGGQFSGFVNVVGGNAEGAQMAGFVNATKGRIKGAQLAGFTNVASDSVKGFQGAGYVNVASKSVDGAQLAGFVNYADSVKGFQGAGFVNVTPKGIKGTQLAGFANVSNDVRGAQIAAFFNRARHVRGVQIGFINVADSIEEGVAVGLINIIGNGMKQLALEQDDVMDVNVAFRSGTTKLYGVLFAGMEVKEDFLWSYGAGFGTQIPLVSKLHTNLEITSQSIHPKEDIGDDLNLLSRFKWNLGYQLANHLSISAGPVLNVYVTNMANLQTGEYGFDIGQNKFYNEMHDDISVQMWVGYNVSVRF